MGQCKTNDPRPTVVKLNISKFGDQGLFIATKIEEQSINMLVDTDASVTVINKVMFDKLYPSSSNVLEPVQLNLVTATGEIAPFYGKKIVEIKIGNYVFNHEILVADIQNDGILGVDFLSPNKIDVLLSKSCLQIKGKKIPCFHFDKKLKPTVCRVTVTEDILVPPGSEILVKGKIIDPVINMETGLVGSLKNIDKTGLMMAYGLVNVENEIIPLRLMNATDTVCKVKKNTITARLEAVDPKNSVVTETKDLNDKVDVNNVCTTQDIPPHLTELYENSCKNLNELEKTKFRALLIKFKDAFSKHPKDIGTTPLIEHTIDTGDATPIKIPPRRIPISKLKQAEQEMAEMADRQIIEPSDSAWCSPVVLINKPDGSLRFCIDYRRLNEKTIKSGQPINRIDDSLDALAGATLFSVLDLRSGYWNVNIAEKDRPKTAFAIPGSGLWQFRKMPFGLCNAPSTFVSLMQKVLRGLSWKICLTYLDDIIVMSKSFDEHLENLSKVISCLQKADLKLHPKKCDLFKEKVSFLGHVVSSEGVATDPEKLESVKNWPVPKNLKQVRSFIGFCSYYRRYVKGFSTVARPLHKLTEAGQKFDFNEECLTAFETLKEALTSAPILGYPNSEDPFILDTDASNDGLGSVLSQIQNGVERVIAYFSKTFSKQERRYCVTRRELLAVVASIKHFHHYLYGQKFVVRSDHGALRWIYNFKNPEGQLARWLETLATYDFKIEHRAGRVHSNADGLSRRPCCESGCNYCTRAEMRYENTGLEMYERTLASPKNVENQDCCDSKESLTNNKCKCSD